MAKEKRKECQRISDRRFLFSLSPARKNFLAMGLNILLTGKMKKDNSDKNDPDCPLS